MTRSTLFAPPTRCCFSSTSRLVTTVLFILVISQACSAAYYGKLIGKLSEFHHGVSGEVYAVDGRTLYIKDFTYDGEGPAAFFYAGTSKSPNGNGFRVRDERGTTDLLKRYRKKDITLTLPEGKTLNNIKWFSVYCDEFAVNFGDVRIPRGFDYPRPQKLAALNGVHGVSSEPVVVVDAQTLLIPGFSYDGEAPDAKFWVGSGQHPSPQGIRVPDENGAIDPLRLYQRKTIVLTLPSDLTVHQIGHFGVWCEAFTVDFGHIQIPPNLNVPPSLRMLGVSPQNLREGQGQTGGIAAVLAASNIPRTFALDNPSASPSYYSQSPSGSASSRGSSLLHANQQYDRPTTYRPALLRRSDDRVQVIKSIDYRVPKSLRPDETFSFATNQRQQLSETDFVQSSPSTTSAIRRGNESTLSPLSIDRDSGEDRATPRSYELGSRASTVDSHRNNFDSQRVVYRGSPRAKTQQQPQQQASYSRLRSFQGDQKSKLNCEVLEDSLAFEVRWAVAGDSIVVQLVGKLDAGQYMSFGLSPSTDRSVMVGGDTVVAWVDKQTLQGFAIDYFLDAKSQCSGGRGSCPDDRIRESTNSVRLLNAAMVNGYSIVTYQRPLKASDELDLAIRTNGSQAIIWAIGPLNERRETSFHSHYLKTDRLIEFGRPPAWNCPMPDGDMPHPHTDNIKKENKQQELVATTRRPQRPVPTPAPAATKNAWVIPPIQCDEPEDGVFYAQMGPTGGKHGYPAITGHVGWGISWYINGLLIPEINVVRGKTYTFVVEGGEDPEVPARYHPFYITDDPIGGYQHKTPEEKAKVKIFAGVRRQHGTVRPMGIGRLCNWLHDPNAGEADDYDSFGAYQRTLSLKCDPGEPGFVEWTPDANTPDTVYYQCFTHRYLGWKINVVDSCDAPAGAASETREVYAQPDQNHDDQLSDLESGSSIRVTSKVTPAPDFYHHHHHHQHHSHPQQQQTTHYQLHRHHYAHYPKHSNKHHAMNPAGNLIITNSQNNNNNNNNNNKVINAQLTSTRGNGIGGNEMEYEQRNPYEMALKSYEEQGQSLPIRSSLYQPAKPANQNQYHHHHHLHLPPRHHQLTGTRVQGEAEAGPLGPMKNNYRVPSVNANSVAAYYDDLQTGRGEGSPVSWSHLANSPATNSASTNGVTLDHHLTEHDQDIHQSSPVPVSVIASLNQLSNIIPDKRPIMSYGQMKFAYPHPGSAQYIYSRPGHSHPHKTTQLILRRPMIQPALSAQTQQQRRPILGMAAMSSLAKESSQSRPIFMERKKSTYPGLSRIIVGTPGHQRVDHRQTAKFTKIPSKQRFKIEAKMSTETQTIDRSTGRTSVRKPAKNTGFDPDSIVIESGFKPIIRDANRETSDGRSQQFAQNLDGYQMDEAAIVGKRNDDKIAEDENFEPMFVPSPLDRKNSTKKRKNPEQAQMILTRTRLDDLDDMEMAADRLDSYYLPPSGSGVATKKIDDRIGAGTLIAYDGKPVDDSSLARSMPRVEAKRSRSRLTSEILSRTPQFGKFKGELPPPIPTDIRTENIPQLERGGLRNKNLGASQTNRAITKLTPFERSKRSSQFREAAAIFDIPEKRNTSRIDDGANREISMHDNEESTLSSTGQMLITNIQYVFLTIVLYFAI